MLALSDVAVRDLKPKSKAYKVSDSDGLYLLNILPGQSIGA